MNRIYKYGCLWLIILLPMVIQAENFTIDEYKVEIKVYGSQGMFEVKETITLDFTTASHGIFRYIPLVYNLGSGKEKYEIKIYDIKVPGYEFKSNHEGNNRMIRIGSPDFYVNGRQTYVITYKVKKAFLFFDEHTEFYWNLTGNDWRTTMDKVYFTIELDQPQAMQEEDYAVFTGGYGEDGKNADVTYYLGKFEGKNISPLRPGEGVTFAAKLPVEYIKRPTKFELFMEKYGNLSIGGLIFMFISWLFYRLWAKYGKDTPIVKMVNYLPPANLDPAEVGTIIDESADNIDIISLLPYWATKGYITIERIESQSLLGKADHELTKIYNLPGHAKAYEKIIFNRIFKSGSKVKISSLENTFSSYMSSAKTALKNHVFNMGIYYPISIKKQEQVGFASVGLIVAGVVLGFVFGSFILFATIALAGVVGLIFTAYMLKKNELGVKFYEQIIGFKMFVKAADKDRIERLLKDDPNYFEKTLPYAMIFGYAKEWGKKFDGLLTEPPTWYVSRGTTFYGRGGTFMPSEFGSSFDNSVRNISSAFTSVPASSGGSSGGGGFSGGGGGFSGGGFGGGGGGSW